MIAHKVEAHCCNCTPEENFWAEAWPLVSTTGLEPSTKPVEEAMLCLGSKICSTGAEKNFLLRGPMTSWERKNQRPPVKAKISKKLLFFPEVLILSAKFK